MLLPSILAASLGLVAGAALAFPLARVLQAVGLSLLALGGFLLYQVWWLSFTSPLKDLPGPKSSYRDG